MVGVASRTVNVVVIAILVFSAFLPNPNLRRFLPLSSRLFYLGDPDVVHLDDPDVFHFTFLYKEIDVRTFCVVESLLRAIDRGEPKDDCINKRITPHDIVGKLTQSHSPVKCDHVPRKGAEIWIWTVGNYSTNSFETARKLHPHLSSILEDPRIVLKFLDPVEMLRGTPMSAVFWDANGTRKDFSKFMIQNLANSLRLAIVYQYGGTYADLDFIFVEDPRYRITGHGVGICSYPSRVNNAFRFPRFDPCLADLMQDFAAHYNGNVWGQNGPTLLSRVMLPQSKKSSGKKIHKSFRQVIDIDPNVSNACVAQLSKGEETDMFIWPHDTLYSLRGEDPFWSWQNVEVDQKVNKYAVAIHWWNKLNGVMDGEFCAEQREKGNARYIKSGLGKLRAKYCPVVNSEFMQRCGL